MAGAGPLKRKSIQRRLREVRAQATAPPLEWCPMPAWALGSDVDILVPVGQDGDDIHLAANTTRAEYVAALKAAVEAHELRSEYLQPEWQARSWSRFVAYRDGDHGPHPCWCSPACLAKHPKDPPRAPSAPAVEHYRSEGGPRQPRDLEAERSRDDERELERLRLLKIANNAGPRWF